MEAGPSNEHSQPKNLILVSPVESGIMNIVFHFFEHKKTRKLAFVGFLVPAS